MRQRVSAREGGWQHIALSLPTFFCFAPEAQRILAGGETTGEAVNIGLRSGRSAGQARNKNCPLSPSLVLRPSRTRWSRFTFPVVYGCAFTTG